MALSLLATKIHLPAFDPGLVARPRLLKRLDAGLRGRLALISAPAGFGKTSLVAGWLGQVRAAGQNVCWLSLDEEDNAPARFWTYVIHALQTADPHLGETARAAFQGPQLPNLETVLVSLINDLAGLPQRLILVIDDYHVISNTEIHTALDFFVEHLPANLLLVITTRQDPPLSLARLRARGQLTELRAADLRFTPEESSVFLNERMALDLPAGDVSALNERTEGWAAGLRLAAISLQTEDDRSGFIRAFTASHRFLTDYLVDEVLSRQTSEVQCFLLRTSILHRFNASLCEAVTSDKGKVTSDELLSQRVKKEAAPSLPPHNSVTNNSLTSPSLTFHSLTSPSLTSPSLTSLENANLFLVPLDSERCWYRYHHLFAQFLRVRLLADEPERVPELYRRAMDWCVAHDLPREALTYALEARDFPRVAALIETVAPAILSQEGPTAVLQWIACLPEGTLNHRPMLCLHYAWALTFLGKLSEAEGYLDLAEKAASEKTEDGDEAVPLTGAQKTILTGYVAAHRAYLRFFKGEYQQTIQYGRQALAQLPLGDDVMRARTATFLGNGLRYAGELQAAQEAYTEATAASQRTGNIYTANMAFVSQAELYLELGRLRQAMQTYEQALEFARQRTGRTNVPFTGFSHFAIGRIYREWNQMDVAAEHLQTGVDLCREWRQADALAIGLMELSFLHADLHAFDRARQALDEVHQIMGVLYSSWGIAMINAFVARLDLLEGDLPAAVRWSETCGLSIHEEPVFERGVEYQTLVQVLIGQGRPSEALVLLERLHDLYCSAGRLGRVLTVQIWQARALADLNQSDRALEVLRKALAFAEPENFIRSFVEAGPPIAGLLRWLPPSPYHERLRCAFPKAIEPADTVLIKDPLPAPVPAAPLETLNERERAVLRLMSVGCSNREIGDELYLSENTIRWYASQIFSKLYVKSRGAAVAKARELGIL